MMQAALVFLVGGFLGSAHCLGMCGGFAAAIGATDIPFWPVFLRQVVYTLGRVFTYAFLGAMGAAAGVYLARYEIPLVSAQQAFSILAGVIMIFVALSVLNVLRLKWLFPQGLGAMLAPAFAHFLNARGWVGFFLAGLVNGFLPCGLVYAFLAKAAGSGHVMTGFTAMAAFGLGTAPAMIAIGCGSRLLSYKARLTVYRLAACFVLVIGVMTIKRAIPSGEGAAPCHEEGIANAQLPIGNGG
jgi:sulfite exporter TauE/SafE